MAFPIVTKINNRVTLIRLSDLDSNIYVIDKNTVVDTGTGSNFVRLYDIFSRLSMDFESIKTIVNTHMHYDHIGGNGFFSNASIHIHERDAPVLEKGDGNSSLADYFGKQMKPIKIDKKLNEGDEINGFEVMHTPGHTPGSICLYDKKNRILISGDTIFANGVGRTDLPGGSEDLLEKSLERISSMDINTLLPGHGDPVLKNAGKTIEKVISLVVDHP